jgi:hypothetical protein
MKQYKVGKRLSDNLKSIYYTRCSTSARSELSQSAWLDWTGGRLRAPLGALVFGSRLTGSKSIWRFIDFTSFCLVFGTESIEQQLVALLDGVLRAQTQTIAVDVIVRQVVLILSEASVGEEDREEAPAVCPPSRVTSPRVTRMRSVLSRDDSDLVKPFRLEEIAPSSCASLPASLETVIGSIGPSSSPQECARLLSAHSDLLPGLRY